MNFDLQAIKERLDLRELFRDDGLDLKRLGANWFVPCPFHEETYRSCMVDQKKFLCSECGAGSDAFDYWERSRGLNRKDAIDQLAVRAGLSPLAHSLQTTISPLAIRPKAVEIIHPQTASEREVWFRCTERLLGDPDEITRIAQWRGIGEDVIKWAADRGLMGIKSFQGEWREAFLVEMPQSLSGSYAAVGTNIRIAPPPSWDDLAHASWNLDPAECGAWPLVVGDPYSATTVLMVEGEWDALALVHLMRWHEEWPLDTAVVGIRGASSCLKFLSHYALNGKATVFVFGSASEAGPGWFRENGFDMQLGGKVSKVRAFSLGKEGTDLNDCVKQGLTRDDMLAIITPKRHLSAPGKRSAPTFLQWCRSHTDCAGPLGLAANFVVTDKTRPKGRRPRKVWVRYWGKLNILPEMREHLATAWDKFKSEFTVSGVPANSALGPRMPE